MIEFIAQAMILAIGIVNAYLYSTPEFHTRKWAYVLCLICQPAWFYTSYTKGQWGMFALSFWFTATAMNGIYRHWIDPNLIKVEDDTEISQY